MGRLKNLNFTIIPRQRDKLNGEDVVSKPEPHSRQVQGISKYLITLCSSVKGPRFRKEKPTAQSVQDDPSHWTDGLSLRAKGFAVIFLINMTFIAVAIGLSKKYDDDRGFLNGAVIYEGSCTLTKRWSTALHLIINILSTCMLAMSTYCMQVLVAPTRQDIDEHHARKRWLDIGYISWRNILVLDKYRLVLLMILAITAIPFHLM